MIGERINMLRKERNLSMRELGEILGVSDGAINKYEKNKSYPSYDVIDKMSRYFEVSLDFLFCRTNIRDSSIVNRTNDLSGFLSVLDDASMGNIRNAYSLLENLSASFDLFKCEEATEDELQHLLRMISDMTVYFNDLHRLRRETTVFNKQVFDLHSSIAADTFHNLNKLLELIFMPEDSKSES
ncbi:helix-turn-helix domain-containing protein [Ruminiclostridium cellobioparum]|uniref:helix-turn-helix domain-containing protein n=1 Tax=Ruminiclostridium cellobioparum TaxID=29355 RepID=UPI0004855BA8|nr:helix-turn-helix transcriptional regulator [Ruminiclostridium cellobioparum]